MVSIRELFKLIKLAHFFHFCMHAITFYLLSAQGQWHAILSPYFFNRNSNVSNASDSITTAVVYVIKVTTAVAYGRK